MYFSSKMLQAVKEIFEVSWYTLSIKLVFLVTKKKKPVDTHKKGQAKESEI